MMSISYFLIVFGINRPDVSTGVGLVDYITSVDALSEDTPIANRHCTDNVGGGEGLASVM